MSYAVEVVAVESEQARHPAKRHQRESIVPAYGVQINEQEHQRIGGSGEANASEVQRQNRGKDDPDRQVLGKPGGSVERVDGEDREKKQVDSEKPEQESRGYAFHIESASSEEISPVQL